MNILRHSCWTELWHHRCLEDRTTSFRTRGNDRCDDAYESYDDVDHDYDDDDDNDGDHDHDHDDYGGGGDGGDDDDYNGYGNDDVDDDADLNRLLALVRTSPIPSIVCDAPS